MLLRITSTSSGSADELLQRRDHHGRGEVGAGVAVEELRDVLGLATSSADFFCSVVYFDVSEPVLDEMNGSPMLLACAEASGLAR